MATDPTAPIWRQELPVVDGAFAAEFVLCVGGHLRASQILCIQLVGHGISTPIIVVFVVIIIYTV